MEEIMEAPKLEFRSIYPTQRYTGQNTWKDVPGIAGCTFVIKPYQRGYRWQESDVSKLLDDLIKYQKYVTNKDKGFVSSLESDGISDAFFDFYCLQTLTVKKIEEGTFELIDGQQRLTTIFLIWAVLETVVEGGDRSETAPFSLQYCRGTEEIDITKKIYNCLLSSFDRSSLKKEYNKQNTNQNNETNEAFKIWLEQYIVACQEKITAEFQNPGGMLVIDRHYIEKNLIRIIKRVVQLDRTTVKNLLAITKKNLYFLWYELSNENDSQNTFTSINSNQIPLTDAELVKSLLLRGENAEINAPRWERLEQELNRNELWTFIGGEANQATKIDLLLALYAMNHGDNPYEPSVQTDNRARPLFDWFERESAKPGFNPGDVLKEIEKIYSKIEEWYNDNAIYHYIGLLSIFMKLKLTKEKNQTELIQTLYNAYNSNETKDNAKFEIQLLERIINCLSPTDNNNEQRTAQDILEDLSYADSSDRPKIQAILWLLNVYETIKAQENVCSGSSVNRRFPFSQAAKKWTIEHIMPQNPEIESENAKDEKYNDLRAKYNILEGNALNDDEVQKMWNLALLQPDDNSSISNGNLSEKRQVIVKGIGEGSFIPCSTVNAFLLYYSYKNGTSDDISMDNATYWTRYNAEKYRGQLVACLKYIMFPGEEN